MIDCALIWIESHPVLVSSVTTVLTGFLAVLAGGFAFFGAKAQARAALEIHNSTTEQAEKSSAAAMIAEIQDLTHRVAVMFKTIKESNSVPSTANEILGRSIIFDYNPEIVSFFEANLATKIVRFYSATDIARLQLKGLQRTQLSAEEYENQISRLSYLVEIGIDVASILNQQLEQSDSFAGWLLAIRNLKPEENKG